jgi:hypothetical protein
MKFYVVVPHIQATRFTKCATESGCASNSFLNGKIRSHVVQQISVAKTPNGRDMTNQHMLRNSLDLYSD